jgi:cell division septum initiation protein DivIVA
MRYADQRRLEDQVERQAQQMRDNQRDNQRRVDQLNEKLEALKAIERSIGSRTPPASAPGEKPAK